MAKFSWGAGGRSNCCRVLPWAARPRSTFLLERRLRNFDPARVRRHGTKLVRRRFSLTESLLVGLRQSRRRVSVRDLLSFCECCRGLSLEISALFFATGGRDVDDPSFCSRHGWIPARSRPKSLFSPLDDGGPGNRAQRLGGLLGCDRLFWRPWSVRMVSVGLL